jgi:hypothetical protein
VVDVAVVEGVTICANSVKHNNWNIKTKKENRMSEQEVVKVGPIDLTERNSAFNMPDNRARDLQHCYFNQQAYQLGSIICSAGEKYQCVSNGADLPGWQNIGTC